MPMLRGSVLRLNRGSIRPVQKKTTRRHLPSHAQKQPWTKSRIASSPNICNGEPCVKGTRIPVFVILSHLASGDDIQVILENYPRLKKQDIDACRQYGAMVERRKNEYHRD